MPTSLSLNNFSTLNQYKLHPPSPKTDETWIRKKLNSPHNYETWINGIIKEMDKVMEKKGESFQKKCGWQYFSSFYFDIKLINWNYLIGWAQGWRVKGKTMQEFLKK